MSTHWGAGQSQFTSTDFIMMLKDEDIVISMDSKGAWRDNVFVERLWRTIKYEEIHLHPYQNVPEARAAIRKYITSTIPKDPIHRLTDGHPIRFISIRCKQSRLQLNKG